MELSDELEKKLLELEERLKEVVKKTVKETVREELSKLKLRGRSVQVGDEKAVIVPILEISIPIQTTLLAIKQSGGKATINQIMEKTGMARSTEAKNLSILRDYGYIEEEKSIEEPRKKIFILNNASMTELGELPEEYKKELIKKRIKNS